MFFVIGKLGQHNIGKNQDRHAHAGPQHAEAMSNKCACVGDSRPLQNPVQAPKRMNLGYKLCRNQCTCCKSSPRIRNHCHHCQSKSMGCSNKNKARSQVQVMKPVQTIEAGHGIHKLPAVVCHADVCSHCLFNGLLHVIVCMLLPCRCAWSAL